MTINAMSLTNGTLTLIVDNGAQILTARSDHPKWTEIVEAFKAGNKELLVSLVSLKAVVETYSIGNLSINSTGVTYRGQPLHTVDSDRVLAFLRDGLPYKPIANYMARKFKNPSARAITELYGFLEHKNMPITDGGNIIAYKGVHNNFFSVHGNTATVVLQGEVDSEGRIKNEIGKTIEVERSSVDDNYRNGCSFGLHAGSLEYAKGWGARLILVEIDPADVVSIPEDCSCQKLRCCKYKILGEYTGAMPHHYTNEFNESPAVKGEDSQSDQPVAEPKAFDSAIQEPVELVQNDTRWENIKNSLYSVIRDQMGDDNLTIRQSDNYIDDLGLDSLDCVELAMAIEEEFGMEIPDEVAEKWTTVQLTIDGIYQMNICSPSTQYNNGYQDGKSDKAIGQFPTYISGDHHAADSDSHANYIRGYVDGYKQ